MGGAAAGCLAMMISITTSGGIGGFGLARTTEVEVEGLPETLRVETCSRLDPAELRELEAQSPRGADRVVYHIEVVDGAAVAAFDLSESALPDETLDLIDSLLEFGAQE